jgi:hypothetical protein
MVKGNPILLVTNAGFGETPVPSEAILQPGDEFNAIADDGSVDLCLVLAVVPAGVPPEYARADQATPRKARPLAMGWRELDELSYLVKSSRGYEFMVLHSVLTGGKNAADERGLNNGR